MAIVSFSGLASGIQWQDMIEQIMNLETARAVSPIQTRVAAQSNRKLAWNSFNSLVKKLSDAASALRDGSAFDVFKTSAAKTDSGLDVVSASASSTASPGSYRVEVIELARAEKVNGSAQASATAQLGLSGEFFVNGKRIEVSATDTLSTVRDKLNAANTGSSPSGVTATILATSSTSHRLILTADETGTRGIELVDGDTGVLQSLGVVSGTTSANVSLTDSARTESLRFSAKTAVLSTMLGITAPPVVTTVSFDGRKIEVDLENDTLISIMNRINDAGGDAEIAEEVVGGRTMYRLSVDGAVTADATGTDPAASQRMVELMGFLRETHVAEISAGSDSTVRIDGFAISRRTNVVSDAIDGVSLNLLTANGSERTASVTGADLALVTHPRTIDAGTYAVAITADGGGNITAVTIDGVAAAWDDATNTISGAAGSAFEGLELEYTGPGVTGSVGNLVVAGTIASQVTVTRNTDNATATVQKFVSAFNELASFVDGQRKAGSPLYANSSLRSMFASVKNEILADVAGLSDASTDYVRGSAVGLSISSTGLLSLDTSVLIQALSTSLADVKQLFGVTGTSTDSELTYVSGLSATQVGTYTVNITHAATRASVAGAALGGGFTYTASDGVSDTLTLTDTYTGTSAAYVVEDGASLNTIVSELNSLFENEGMQLEAENDGGALRITATEYGTDAGITLAGAEATTRLGHAAGSTFGTDVAGNFEDAEGTTHAATGTGQSLVGDDDTAAEGLTVKYTGSLVGAAGDLTYTRGLAGAVVKAAELITRAGEGAIALMTETIDDSVETLTQRISDAQARLELRRSNLIQQFTRMEEAMGKAQAQGAWIASQVKSLWSPNQEY